MCDANHTIYLLKNCQSEKTNLNILSNSLSFRQGVARVLLLRSNHKFVVPLPPEIKDIAHPQRRTKNVLPIPK